MFCALDLKQNTKFLSFRKNTKNMISATSWYYEDPAESRCGNGIKNSN